MDCESKVPSFKLAHIRRIQFLQIRPHLSTAWFCFFLMETLLLPGKKNWASNQISLPTTHR